MRTLYRRTRLRGPAVPAARTREDRTGNNAATCASKGSPSSISTLPSRTSTSRRPAASTAPSSFASRRGNGSRMAKPCWSPERQDPASTTWLVPSATRPAATASQPATPRLPAPRRTRPGPRRWLIPETGSAARQDALARNSRTASPGIGGRLRRNTQGAPGAIRSARRFKVGPWTLRG